MLTNMNVRVRPHRPVAGIRQQVAAKPLPKLSGELLKPATGILAIALVSVILLSQLLHHQVIAAASRIAELEQRQATLAQEHKELKSGRAQLTSEAYMVAVAGAKFDLHAPAEGQVHRWR